jgi:hypothetical protein
MPSYDTFDYRGETFLVKKIGKGRNTVRKPHFRWRGMRLYFCLGGQAVAAWPAKDKDMYMALVKTHMTIGKSIELSRDQQKIRRLALKLREALLRAADGPRHRSAFRQLMRLETWINETELQDQKRRRDSEEKRREESQVPIVKAKQDRPIVTTKPLDRLKLYGTLIR